MSPAVISRTVQSSELSRNSAAVFKAVDQGPVTITRRDGETLILTKESDLAHQREGFELAAHLVAASLAPGDVPFVDRLRGPFPWVEFFKPSDRETFAQEIVDVARACAAVSSFERLLLTLIAWRSTAQAIADGYTHDENLEWLGVPEPVADPHDA
jgi:PHD/YefM family antitoxin component YafN of YafNO toxin-antitoxin module